MELSPAPRYRRMLKDRGYDSTEFHDQQVIHAFLRESLLNARQLTSEEAAKVWARLTEKNSGEPEE